MTGPGSIVPARACPALTLAGWAGTPCFALYNGALGLTRRSLWHGSICVYYLLLSLLRGAMRWSRWRGKAFGEGEDAGNRRVLCMLSGGMLVMDLALVVPISLLVLDGRPGQMGMIPAITSAVYATCKISAAAMRVKRERGGPLDRELRGVGLMDALVSVLVLQNTLIVAVEGGISQRMLPLTALSGLGVFLANLVISLWWMMRAAKGDRERAEK